MEERIKELIKSLERQKVEYASIIRAQTTEIDKSFFCGKLAGLLDEIIDLEWILTGKEVK